MTCIIHAEDLVASLWLILCAKQFGSKLEGVHTGMLSVGAHDSLVRAGSEVAYPSLVVCTEDMLNACIPPAGAVAAAGLTGGFKCWATAILAQGAGTPPLTSGTDEWAREWRRMARAVQGRRQSELGGRRAGSAPTRTHSR
jgi:hypothetical protein